MTVPLQSSKPRKRGRPITHGLARCPEYRAWQKMKDRCSNPRNQRYDRYGARGIRVCTRWLGGFLAFFEDIGGRPSPRHSLGRIDNERGYDCGKCPDCITRNATSNCRWETAEEQNGNRADNHFLKFQGRKQTLAAWAREFGMGKKTLEGRLKRGLSVEVALTAPIGRWAQNRGELTEPRPERT